MKLYCLEHDTGYRTTTQFTLLNRQLRWLMSVACIVDYDSGYIMDILCYAVHNHDGDIHYYSKINYVLDHDCVQQPLLHNYTYKYLWVQYFTVIQ